MLSPPHEMKILSVLAEKQKLKFSRSTLFHMKTRVCLKFFVNNCSLESVLCTGITVAVFSIEGKTAEKKEMLNIS